MKTINYVELLLLLFKGPAPDLFFALKHALKENFSRLVERSDFVKKRKSFYRAH